MIFLCFMILRLPITAFVLHNSNFEGIQKLKKTELQSNISQDSETLSKILTLKIIQTELGEDALCERSLRNGLSAEEANKMLEKYGENVIETERKTNVMDLWLAQFDERLVQILLFVALISCISSIPAVFNSVGSQNDVVLQSFIEPCVIILILVINSGVGVWQQLSAIQSLDALKTLLPKLATVLRRDEEGRSNVIANFDASKLVPGDIVRLKVGDVIPADACITSLMSSSVLTIDESTLTGESIPVHKFPIHEANCDLSEKVLDDSGRRDPLLEDGRLYSGTTVTKGRKACSCYIEISYEFQSSFLINIF
jgi:magnesium-transporting ATPase (P-type)